MTETLNSLSLVIGSELDMKEVMYWSEEKEDELPITEEMLNTVFSDDSEIIVKMPASTWKEYDYYNPEGGEFVYPRTIRASNGNQVRVRDILDEWIANNRRIDKLYDLIKEKEGQEIYGLFGDHVYFEGIQHVKDNIYTMESYGS